MKKNLIALAFAGIATLAGTSKTNAQLVSNSNSLEYQRSFINDQGTINRKALKDFANTYRNVTDEKWMQAKDGFIVRFILEEVKTSVSYDKKGNWIARIKYYSEDKMPRDIRHIVKSNYYDYTIIGIQEIETMDSNGIPTYIVNMENKTQIKVLRLNAGNMEVWKEFNRSE